MSLEIYRDGAAVLIRQNLDLIKLKKFKALFDTTTNPNTRGAIGEMLVKAGIPFMNFLHELPSECFCGSDLTEITIPKTIEHINAGAFRNCKNLRQINISGQIEGIGAMCFQDCENLVAFPRLNLAYTKVITDGAFCRCASLKKITLMPGVEEIQKCAFEDCINVQEITLPPSIKHIEWGAFRNMDSLKMITYLGTVEEWVEVRKDRYWISLPNSLTIQFVCQDGTYIVGEEDL